MEGKMIAREMNFYCMESKGATGMDCKLRGVKEPKQFV
jgi:hypothetical protein